MIQCEINGKSYKVKEGTTIIEAFHQHKVDIAHYCWHPGLSVAGVCRLCMVHIEGNPKLQIACNTRVVDGMKISNQEEVVKEAVRWGLDFHLINHPLDCPICDQAGECGLQDQYMQFGKYTPEMVDRKVKKRKVVDLGKRIVLDTERCILCSRCVRFTEEVTKTNELGIFNRGDRAEIGTVNDRPLDNKYSLNTVDICPVGALTAKDFRFRQRVWYLKEAETVCPGCSTGCNISVHFNREGLFRVKPIYNAEINGYWMCDEGRDVYKFVNRTFRLTDSVRFSKEGKEILSKTEAVQRIREGLRSVDPNRVAVVLTGQYTLEEYNQFIDYFLNEHQVKSFYHWVNQKENFEDFDGLLLRGDRNPNTKGLLQVLEEKLSDNVGIWGTLESALEKKEIDWVFVAGPENPLHFPDIEEKMKKFSLASNLVWFGSAKAPDKSFGNEETYFLPTATFFEKSGTFINFKGFNQKIEPGAIVVPGASSLEQWVEYFRSKEGTAIPKDIENLTVVGRGLIHNEMSTKRGSL